MMNQELQGRKIMERRASDNKYLHKDFHISQNMLMGYIYNNFGKESLIRYLEQYAKAYYQPLNQKMRSGNIEALHEYLIDIYKKEEWPVKINLTKDAIEIEQKSCPGISHIRSKGDEPCPFYSETYTTIYKILCKGTPFEYELEYFDYKTGACKQVFIRKEENR